MYLYTHVGFVVGANLLDPDVVLGVDERFCGGVSLGESDDTGYVLEFTVIIHLYLENRTEQNTQDLKRQQHDAEKCVLMCW